MDYILTVFSLGIRLTWIIIFADEKNTKNKTYEPNFVVNDCTVHTFQISLYVLLLCLSFFPL
jgi:hypothetical protein